MTSSVKPSPSYVPAAVRNFAERPSVKNAATYTFNVAKSAVFGGIAGKAVEYASNSNDTTNQLAITGAIAAAIFDAAMPISNRIIAYTNSWSTQASKLLGTNHANVLRQPIANLTLNSIITKVGFPFAAAGLIKLGAETAGLEVDLPHAFIYGAIAPRIAEGVTYLVVKTIADQVETLNAVVQDVKAVRDERAAQTKAAVAGVAAKTPTNAVSVKAA